MEIDPAVADSGAPDCSHHDRHFKSWPFLAAAALKAKAAGRRARARVVGKPSGPGPRLPTKRARAKGY
jgi:hypothetical protein